MAIKMSPANAAKLGLDVPGSRAKLPKAKKAPNADEHYRTMVRAACAAHGIPEPMFEFYFAAPQRDWRFDLAWDGDRTVALEVEGGLWASVHGKKSRHFHGKGILGDMEKYNDAACRGWRVLRCTPQDVESGAIWPTVKRALGV